VAGHGRSQGVASARVPGSSPGAATKHFNNLAKSYRWHHALGEAPRDKENCIGRHSHLGLASHEFAEADCGKLPKQMNGPGRSGKNDQALINRHTHNYMRSKRERSKQL
jgi:hypothetical protein